MFNAKNHPVTTIRSILSMVSRPVPVLNEKTGKMEKRTPTAAQLRANAEEVISSPDGSITVYSSGYAVCNATAGTVVVDLSKCRDGYQQTYAIGSEGVSGSFTLDPETTDWHWIVMEIAEDQAERNLCHRKADRLGIGISIDGQEGDAWETEIQQRQELPGEALERQETIAETMDVLTDRQKEIATFYFIDGKTQSEIADTLGISQAAVHYALDSVKKRWQKLSEEI